MSARRSALGRGLGALIPGADAARKPRTDVPVTTPTSPESKAVAGPDVATQAPVPGAVGWQMLRVTDIDPNPEQPRRRFDPVQLKQLAESILRHGVLQPVVVRRVGDRYQLVVGERRWRASRAAGKQEIPAVVADVDPAEQLELAIIENVQRHDLNPMELAHAYRALADAGHTQEEFGRKVSMARASVATPLRLRDLGRDLRADVESGTPCGARVAGRQSAGGEKLGRFNLR